MGSESQHVCRDDYRSRLCICQSLALQQVSTTSKDFANIVSGVFMPIVAKHTKSFTLVADADEFFDCTALNPGE